MSRSSRKLNRTLIQAFGVLFGIAIAVWILRGFGVLNFMPGGIILVLFILAILVGVASYAQKTWWRF